MKKLFLLASLMTYFNGKGSFTAHDYSDALIKRPDDYKIFQPQGWALLPGHRGACLFGGFSPVRSSHK